MVLLPEHDRLEAQQRQVEALEGREGTARFQVFLDKGQEAPLVGMEEADGGPFPIEGVLIELDPAKRNGEGDAGPTGHTGAVEG